MFIHCVQCHHSDKDGVPTEEEIEGNEDPFGEFQNESEPGASIHDETQSVTECSIMDGNPGNFQ